MKRSFRLFWYSPFLFCLSGFNIGGLFGLLAGLWPSPLTIITLIAAIIFSGIQTSLVSLLTRQGKLSFPWLLLFVAINVGVAMGIIALALFLWPSSPIYLALGFSSGFFLLITARGLKNNYILSGIIKSDQN